MSPPPPAFPRLPKEAPSELSLNHHSCGLFQQTGMIECLLKAGPFPTQEKIFSDSFHTKGMEV